MSSKTIKMIFMALVAAFAISSLAEAAPPKRQRTPRRPTTSSSRTTSRTTTRTRTPRRPVRKTTRRRTTTRSTTKRAPRKPSTATKPR